MRRRPSASRGYMLKEDDGAAGARRHRLPPDVLTTVSVPLDAPLPLVEVLRTGQPFWFESEEQWPATPPRARRHEHVGVGLPCRRTARSPARSRSGSRRRAAFQRRGARARPRARRPVLLGARAARAARRGAAGRGRPPSGAEDRRACWPTSAWRSTRPWGLTQRFDAWCARWGRASPNLPRCAWSTSRRKPRWPPYAHADPAKHELVGATYGG